MDTIPPIDVGGGRLTAPLDSVFTRGCLLLDKNRGLMRESYEQVRDQIIGARAIGYRNSGTLTTNGASAPNDTDNIVSGFAPTMGAVRTLSFAAAVGPPVLNFGYAMHQLIYGCEVNLTPLLGAGLGVAVPGGALGYVFPNQRNVPPLGIINLTMQWADQYGVDISTTCKVALFDNRATVLFVPCTQFNGLNRFIPAARCSNVSPPVVVTQTPTVIVAYRGLSDAPNALTEAVDPGVVVSARLLAGDDSGVMTAYETAILSRAPVFTPIFVNPLATPGF